jgi:hypothetical protein
MLALLLMPARSVRMPPFDNRNHAQGEVKQP